LDKNRFFFKKCVIRNDRLMGIIFIGDDNEMKEYKVLIEQGTELGDKRNQLLRSGSKKAVMTGRMICSCNQVGEGNIEQAIKNGSDSLEAIMAATNAGTGCGSCKPELKELLKKIKR
jgi:ferredoxin-nitrate reductase